MSTRRSLAVAATAVLLAVAGCAGDTEPRAELPQPDRTGPTVSDDAGAVVALRVVVSGGVAGRRDVLTLRRAQVPPGMSRVLHGRVLRLAGRIASRKTPGGSAGVPTCCDIRTVELDVGYADGTRVRVALAETRLPAPLARLLSLLSGGRP